MSDVFRGADSLSYFYHIHCTYFSISNAIPLFIMTAFIEKYNQIKTRTCLQILLFFEHCLYFSI